MCSNDIGSWDFTPVIDLINSLSARGGDSLSSPSSCSSSEPTTPETLPEDDNALSHLGNFDKLWTYLGQPLDVPPPLVKPETGYGSIGTKYVKWRDEIEGADLEDIRGETKQRSPIEIKNTHAERLRRWKETSVNNLPLTQKQKRNQQGKEWRSQSQREPEGPPQPFASSDSEHDILGSRPPPDRRALIQDLLYGNAPQGRAEIHRRSSCPPQKDGKPEVKPPIHFRITRESYRPTEQSVDMIATAKKARLIMLLSTRFVDDSGFLARMGLKSQVESSAFTGEGGIHVFIDASNIIIGLHETIKMLKHIPTTSRSRRQLISFYNLSIILERGRPTAKRVLVGSDKFEIIHEAKTIGYETNILDRVHKAKELTPRQKKFLVNGNGTSGQSSGSETTAMHAPGKWVEQGVDEVLHLKILESLVDAKEPSTIVLATGDAAEAEYSAGFLRMVERALEKGWKVELVSFRRNISGAYRRKAFMTKWVGRFRIIELDEFVDELLVP